MIKNKTNNILVVGAGFSGAVVARELAEAGSQVTVIDKRDHIAGNCYDYVNEHGIRVHRYGPHIFHTSNPEVMTWLQRFSDWTEYYHRVKAILDDGTYVTFPVNAETKARVGAENVLDIFFRPYTKKMWGMEIEQLDASIINRLPTRDDMCDLYFPNDLYQCLPTEGYTRLFERILDHENILIKLNTHYDKTMNAEYDHVFNSMPIDEYFDFCHGPLPYRSLRFHTVTLPTPRLLPTATVNFTHSGPYTRMVEWKNLPEHGTNNNYTTVTYEEPCDYRDNNMERYYPVKDVDGRNREIYRRYRELVPSNMEFIGRCGLYVYFDMHQAIASSLAVAQNFLKHNEK